MPSCQNVTGVPKSTAMPLSLTFEAGCGQRAWKSTPRTEASRKEYDEDESTGLHLGSSKLMVQPRVDGVQVLWAQNRGTKPRWSSGQGESRGVFLEEMTSKLSPKGSLGVSGKVHNLGVGIQSRKHHMHEGREEQLHRETRHLRMAAAQNPAVGSVEGRRREGAPREAARGQIGLPSDSV